MPKSRSKPIGPHHINDDRHHERLAAKLCTQCKIMRAIHARLGVPPLREFESGFAGLARIVVGQQLSAASAAAIWSRVHNAIKPFEAPGLLACSGVKLSKLGLSTAKIKTLNALASAVQNGLDIQDLSRQPDEVIIATLTAIHGIGPWTADIFLLFVLRRADAFPPGDLALQIAAQRHFKLKSRPSAAELTRLAARWKPWRGIAARLLWADYGASKRLVKGTAAPLPAPKSSKAAKLAEQRKSQAVERVAKPNSQRKSKLHTADMRR